MGILIGCGTKYYQCRYSWIFRILYVKINNVYTYLMPGISNYFIQTALSRERPDF